MEQSEVAVRTLTRVVARYVSTDRQGVEHVVAEKQGNPEDYSSYVAGVGRYRSSTKLDGYYVLYVDDTPNDSFKKSLIRILLDETDRAGLVVEELTVPEPDDDGQIELVGPTAFEIFGDVPYDGWRPMDIVERTEVPSSDRP